MFKGVHHFNLIVSDMEKSKKFYHQILGLEIALETVIEDPEFSRGVCLSETKLLATFFKLPNSSTCIEAFQYLSPSDGKPLPSDKKAHDIGWTHLCFEVEDIEKARQELEAKGVNFLTSPVTLSKAHPHLPSARFCYFLGPDNEVLEILQP